MDSTVGQTRHGLSTPVHNAGAALGGAGRRRALGVVIAAVPIAFLTVFYLLPTVTMLWRSVSDGSVRDASELVSIGDTLRFTAWQAALSTFVTLVVGLAIAALFVHVDFPTRRGLRAGLAVPFVLPTTVVASAFIALGERFGLESLTHGFGAVIAAHVYFNIAIVTRLVGVRWAAVDPRTEQASRSLGAGAIRRFVSVTLPAIRGAVISSAVIVFLFCFTSYGIILILGGPGVRTIETEIARFAITRNDPSTAAVLSMIQIIVVMSVVAGSSWFDSRRGDAVPGAPLRRPARPRRLRGRVASWLIAGWLWIALCAPLSALALRSFQVGDGYGLANYRSLSHRLPLLGVSGYDALVNSLQAAVVATLIAMLVGVCGAITVASARRVGAGSMSVLTMLPLGTSAVTIGFGLLITFDSSLWNLRSRWIIIPIAHALIAIPFVLRPTLGALRAIPTHVRESARSLGASRLRVATTIDTPLVAGAVAVGASFAFAVSLGEFGATSFLGRRPAQTTAPQAIFRLLGRPGESTEGQAMALATALMVIVAVVVFLLDLRREERSTLV
jgi:thiamine transport system permease protein